MKALIFGPGTSPLELTERATPKPARNEVLIKVSAAGLNRADLAQRKGNYPAPPGTVQDILGLEVSGTIIEVGKEVGKLKAGDQVCALLPGGGYAEYVTVDAGSCLPIPNAISLQDAAALPEVLFTVWYNIFQRGRLKKDQNVLIYGGSGGIGSMAIQLVSLFGAHPFTLASSEEKIRYCHDLGAEKVVNYKTEEVVEVIGENSIDVILDSVGGDYLDANIKLLKPEAHLIYINAMEGGKPGLNIFKMMQKRIWVTGSTLRSRSSVFKRKLADAIVKGAYPLLENHSFKNPVKYRYPVEKAEQAHRVMESRDFKGKIILQF